ncbi:MAG: hypothetical protein WCN88_03790 [Candidatus Falkowbacteria bacterium]
MLNNLDPKSRPRPSILGGATKRPRLSLNLHTMPQTVTSHWKKWLVLGFLILGIFAIVSFLLYTFTQ